MIRQPNILEVHSTSETEFDRLKEKVMSVYRDFTTGQGNAYIRNELNYMPGRNISKQFWMQMNSALVNHYYSNPFDGRQKAVLEYEYEYIAWILDDGSVDTSYDEYEHNFLSPDKEIVQAIHFYLNCDKNEFCNFIELSFKLKTISKILGKRERSQLVGVINRIFSLYSLYNVQLELTPFAYNRNILEYPRVIIKAEPLMYKEAIEPALSVLRVPRFQPAYYVFLDALSDYQNEHFSGCMTKCGSAFESVLKILHGQFESQTSKKHIPVPKRIKHIVKHLKLDEFLTPTLELTPTLKVIPKLRNEFGDAHGHGEEVVNVSPHIAQYAVNCTASAILMLVNESY